MDQENQNPDQKHDANALEKQSQDQQNIENPDALDAQARKTAQAQAALKEPLAKRIVGLLRNVNIYLLAFLLLMGIAITVTYVAQSSENNTPTITGQSLSDEQLDGLVNQEYNIGDVSQTLTVEANAIFNGRVLVKDNLDVAGSINVGGPLTLPGITVSGTSAFDNVEIGNDLNVLGDTNIQGSITFNGSISVPGDGSFGGSLSASRLTVDTIDFSGDLNVSRHIDTGGPNPGISPGGAIGAGGTVSLSGTDTSGTVTINTGNGASNGTLATINFSRAFNETPQVLISPVGQDAGVLDYYVTRTSSSFTIRTANSAANSRTYVFDFWAVE